MGDQSLLLAALFDGWDGYHTSIVHAIETLSEAQLAWRVAAGQRSVGEAAWHIAMGRIGWFVRMAAPRSHELYEAGQALLLPGGEIVSANANDLALLLHWLDASWGMIDETLHSWTAADLARTFVQPYQGKVYACSFQWTLWRIMSHDIHHGGQLALMLGMQGIPVPELGDLGGHLTVPPLVEPGAGI